MSKKKSKNFVHPFTRLKDKMEAENAMLRQELLARDREINKLQGGAVKTEEPFRLVKRSPLEKFLYINSKRDIKFSEPLQTQHEEHFERMAVLFRDAFALMEIKNRGYTGQSGDPFSNFRNPVYDKFILGGGFSNPWYDSVTQGIITRFLDKVTRIQNILYTGEVNFDSLDDTIKDGINYLAILYSYLHDRK